ncbi:fimbrial protein [Enterobacter hormaechei]|uniref:fimbrial protein n=4 Tax=Gammaproteobacteria TaxID=1236 RepID=UPI001F46C0F7|nr:fimbrial protein [Enterobacter hormaechei]HCJ7331522.1 type 1 fimbrial protein [Enterobacter hormaechei subsp. xiangfangensis]HDS9686172.1 type 1 fimbrial protein [Enterobacter hormaechei subsp. oharae]MCF2344627.1 type 1 fimbrial protein [Enterobacter hormaechei]HCJ7619888.1 type 1 fimbrial protein [Enterobacter hormaechei subsp. xiangfangensis]HCT5798088.1 type 1 fimbrial protein [Enterobacter hormaechei]
MKMLLLISLFIMMKFPSLVYAAPVCDNTNIGVREVVLPVNISSLSPGVDLSTTTSLLSISVFGSSFLGVSGSNPFNCHSTNGDFDNYEMYVFIEPLSAYGNSYVFTIGYPVYSVIATNAPALGVGFNSAVTVPGMSVPAYLLSSWRQDNSGGLGYSVQDSSGYIHISLANASLLQPGVVMGSALPVFGIYGIIYKNDGTPYDGKKISMGTVHFSGALDIIPFTCQTPDVIVPMGKYKTTDFTGVGSTSPWVDFNIELNNCPGNYPGYRNGLVKNNISILINSVYGNPTPESFSLKSGTGSATGIDMQVRKQNDTSMISMGTGFDPLGPVTGNTGVTQLRIPLQARYIQSGGQVTPGLAESALTFTIDYY